MTTKIPKPIHCGQNWLEMTPTNGGRICGQCYKKIVDFSNMSWMEIEQIQSQNNNEVCGMYNPKQLDYWGQEIPSHKDKLLKALAITGICVSFTSLVNAQSDSLIIKGKVIDKQTNEALAFASVILKNHKDTTITDIDGNFKLVVKNIPKITYPDTLEVKYIGYLPLQMTFKNLNSINDSVSDIGLRSIDLTLTPTVSTGIIFYVKAPTLGQKIKWKFHRWFKRKKQ